MRRGARLRGSSNAQGSIPLAGFQRASVKWVPARRLFLVNLSRLPDSGRPAESLPDVPGEIFTAAARSCWMALTPPELVQGTLKLDQTVMGALRKGPAPVVPV